MENNNYIINSVNPILYETQETLDFRARIGRRLGLATALYAAISTFCIYKNLSGITMPFFGIITLIYMIYGLKQYDVVIKRSSWFYGAILMALSVSDFLTANELFISLNNLGIILMIFIFLLHNVYDDRRWNFSKTFIALCESFIYSAGSVSDFGKDMKEVTRRCINGGISYEKKRTIKYVFIGLVIAMPIVGFLIGVLANADIVFNDMLIKYCHIDYDFGELIVIGITFLFIYFSAYCTMRFFSKKTIREDVVSRRIMEPVIAITVLSLVSVVYLLFSLIQIRYLFIGGGSLPNGYSYAQYAREGFFQLLGVSILNFLMVLFVNSFFRESRILKALMTLISLCTYIMIASSFIRILMYIEVFHLTLLRLLVLWALTVLSILFAAVIISIFKNGFPLFKCCVVVVSLLYVMLSFAHPDYIIAKYNLSYADTTGSNMVARDCNYLKSLSADAAPIIGEYDTEWADDYFRKFHSNAYTVEKASGRKLNLSVYTAEKIYNSRRMD